MEFSNSLSFFSFLLISLLQLLLTPSKQSRVQNFVWINNEITKEINGENDRSLHALFEKNFISTFHLSIDIGRGGRRKPKGESLSFLARTGVKRERWVYTREEDSNYRSGTENAGFHQTLRGTILDKYSCFRIASMPPSLSLLPLSHFIGTGYVKNLLAPRRSSIVQVYPQR